MSKQYINQEVDKIIKDKNFDFPLNMAMTAAWIIGQFKGINLKILDVQKVSSLADFFVLASTSNTVQASSIAEEIVSQFKRNNLTICSKEGLEDTDWILIDAGDIIVHIFQEASREIYNLDSLWREAPSIPIPENYYMTTIADQDMASGSEENYF